LGQPPVGVFDPASSHSATATPSIGAPAAAIADLVSVLVSINELLATKLDGRGDHDELVRVGRLAARRVTEIVDHLGRRRAALRGRRVLVVEDDVTLLRTLVRGLLAEGFEAVGAENGRRAVALLPAFKPDLLVTDLVMPEMDGISLIREVKRLRPDLRIVAITGGGLHGRAASYLKWAAELGADEVLTKPFSMSSLLAAVRLQLGASAAAPADTACEGVI